MIELPTITELVFDGDSHTYALNGYVIPSVTQLMRPMSGMAYNGIPADVLFEAAARGTRVHEQVSNYVLYGVDEADEDTQPYLDAFHAFEHVYNPTWIASEFRVYHKLLNYAGTLDLIGYVTPDDGKGVDLVDLKCTSAYHPVMLETQLAGYAEALRSHGVTIRTCYGLQLQKIGIPRCEKADIMEGYKTFLHCLAIYNAMQVERNMIGG